MKDEYMPQRWNPAGPGDLRTYPMVLKKHPELAAGVALVMCEWAALEHELISTFNFCLFTMRGEARTSARISQIAWDTMESGRSRLAVLEAIAGERLAPQFRDELIEKIFPKVRKRAAERNRIAHARWWVADKHPNCLITLPEDPEQQFVYSVKDFDEIAKRMVETANLISTLFHKVTQHSMQHEMPLVQAKEPPRA